MTQKETFHFVGIGGIGMSGLARILLQKGNSVTGSDIAENYVIEGLRKEGATVHIGHKKENIKQDATVVFSSDIADKNPEIEAAKKYNCPILHRSDLLKKLTQDHSVLAIGGTHGKTTTTSLLIHVLKEAGWDPAFSVGGIMLGYNTNAKDGNGEYFVLEGDESDATFLKYSYHMAIVTNIDTDHIEHYGSLDKLIAAFKEFMEKAKDEQLLFYCGDDPILSKLKVRGTSYGFNSEAQLKGMHFRQEGFKSYFDVRFKGNFYSNIEVPLIGEFNALNALAVFGLAINLGVTEQVIRAAFSSFLGVKRRCEKKSEVSSISIYDDYAHHPTAVKATLKAMRTAVRERRVVAVLQPHRFSRLKHCYSEFINSFSYADCVIVTDIYGANEKQDTFVTNEKIVEIIRSGFTGPVHFISRKNLAHDLSKFLMPHDVVITLGAGCITKLNDELNPLLKEKPKKLKIGLIFGGMNVEHDVSCISAKNIGKGLCRDIYDIELFRVDRQGCFEKWSKEIESAPKEGDYNKPSITKELFSELLSCDLFFPVLHGSFGEDGLMQGFFEILKKPYVGCDVRSSSISMDKVLMKRVAEQIGIKTSPFVSFNMTEWEENKKRLLEEIKLLLSPVYYVKPVHLGSSRGISRIDDYKDLENAITQAFQYDTHVLVEKAIVGREIEFAVLGNFHPHVTAPGEILADGKFYSYEMKYSKDGFPVTNKAKLSSKEIEEGKYLVKKIYTQATCTGLARVDFFLDSNGQYWFNEINPIPGFTSISLYPQMMEQDGCKISELLDKLIILALERSRIQEKKFVRTAGTQNHL